MEAHARGRGRPGAGAFGAEVSGEAALRADLSSLKIGALARRATEMGVADDLVDEADDVEALVELIVAAKVEADDNAMRAELSSLKIGALARRATEMGVADDLVDEADDVEALVELIMAAKVEDEDVYDDGDDNAMSEGEAGQLERTDTFTETFSALVATWREEDMPSPKVDAAAEKVTRKPRPCLAATRLLTSSMRLGCRGEGSRRERSRRGGGSREEEGGAGEGSGQGQGGRGGRCRCGGGSRERRAAYARAGDRPAGRRGGARAGGGGLQQRRLALGRRDDRGGAPGRRERRRALRRAAAGRVLPPRRPCRGRQRVPLQSAAAGAGRRVEPQPHP